MQECSRRGRKVNRKEGVGQRNSKNDRSKAAVKGSHSSQSFGTSVSWAEESRGLAKVVVEKGERVERLLGS